MRKETKHQPVQLDLFGNPLEPYSPESPIRVAWVRGKRNYVLADVARVLGLKVSSPTLLAARLPSGLKARTTISTPGGVQRNVLTTCDKGVLYLASTSRKDPRILLRMLGLAGRSQIVPISKETHAVTLLSEAFEHHGPSLQHTCDPYKIDLYLAKPRIAIECDEHGHSVRDAAYEQEREQFIASTLDCRFVRFNPDAPEYSIGRVVNQVMRLIDAPRRGRVIDVVRRAIA